MVKITYIGVLGKGKMTLYEDKSLGKDPTNHDIQLTQPLNYGTHEPSRTLRAIVETLVLE